MQASRRLRSKTGAGQRGAAQRADLFVVPPPLFPPAADRAADDTRWRRQLDLATELVRQHALIETFHVIDSGRVESLYGAWRQHLPDVRPFYAVKCNPDPVILRTIAGLGGGFDCASDQEIESVLATGALASPGRDIVLAHPCKRQRDLERARRAGVELTVFDAEAELAKIAAFHPGCGALLRLRCDDPHARVKLGKKYGADPEEVPHLMAAAAAMGVPVVGACFHVGSSSVDAGAFVAGIDMCSGLFERYESLRTLDIGGGFSARTFPEYARPISAALARAYERVPRLRGNVMAEPGRFFAETSGFMCAVVQGVRNRRSEGRVDYWISDGLYGSLNCILYDGQRPKFSVMRSPSLPPIDDAGREVTRRSTLWGPTCDSADCVYQDLELPELRVGDYLVFHDAGAYTLAGACGFNGIRSDEPVRFYRSSLSSP